MFLFILGTLITIAAIIADVETSERAFAKGATEMKGWPGIGWIVGPRPSRWKMYAVFSVEVILLGVLQHFFGWGIMIARAAAAAGHAFAASANAKI